MARATLRRSQQTRRREDPMPGTAIEHPEDRARSFVLYGRSGTGKTTLACTFPKPLLLLDLKDDGTDSVADVKGVTFRRISSVEEYEEMIEWLQQHPDKFKSVVTDTCSQLQEMALQELFGERKLKKGQRLGDWGTMRQQDWGRLSATMKSLLIDMRDLTPHGINMVFIAQDKIFTGETEDRPGMGEIDPEVGPALITSVAKILNAAVSVIGHTFIDTKEIKKEVNGKKKVTGEKAQFGLRVGPNSVYTAKIRKSRATEVPSRIYDPTYADLLDIILGE